MPHINVLCHPPQKSMHLPMDIGDHDRSLEFMFKCHNITKIMVCKLKTEISEFQKMAAHAHISI